MLEWVTVRTAILNLQEILQAALIILIPLQSQGEVSDRSFSRDWQSHPNIGSTSLDRPMDRSLPSNSTTSSKYIFPVFESVAA
jgi:hypothetical protein